MRSASLPCRVSFALSLELINIVMGGSALHGPYLDSRGIHVQLTATACSPLHLHNLHNNDAERWR